MRSACVFIWVRWTNGRRVWGGSSPPCALAGWLYFSEDGARDGRGMTRLVPLDALDDGTTRSRRGRCDHARRVRPDRAPARPASRVYRRHLTRRSAKSMGWNPKNPMVRGCGRGHGRSTAALLTDFLSALSHPVESNAKGNARRPLATPSVPVEEGYGARRTRNIQKLGSRLGQKLHPTKFYGRTKSQKNMTSVLLITASRVVERKISLGVHTSWRADDASDSEDDDDMETRPQKTP